MGTFAVLVEDERRQAEDRLLQGEAQLAETQRLSRMGTWELDVASGSLSWTAELYRIFGVDPAHFRPTFDDLLTVVHPDDREHVRRVCAAAFRAGDSFDIEHRVVHPNGELRWVHGRGRVVLGPDGHRPGSTARPRTSPIATRSRHRSSTNAARPAHRAAQPAAVR